MDTCARSHDAELSVGPLLARDDEEQSARQAHLQQAEADFNPLPFDAAAARALGQVAASLRCSGRKTGARAHPGVHTCNTDGFGGIYGHPWWRWPTRADERGVRLRLDS